MKLVRATDRSSVMKVKINDLGRIAMQGEEFIVSDARAEILAGKNKYRAVFATVIKSVVDEKATFIEDDVPVITAPIVEQVEPQTEEPVIEEPVETVEVVEEQPKKRKRSKKVEE